MCNNYDHLITFNSYKRLYRNPEGVYVLFTNKIPVTKMMGMKYFDCCRWTVAVTPSSPCSWCTIDYWLPDPEHLGPTWRPSILHASNPATTKEHDCSRTAWAACDVLHRDRKARGLGHPCPVAHTQSADRLATTRASCSYVLRPWFYAWKTHPHWRGRVVVCCSPERS